MDFLISIGGCLAAAFLSLIFLMFNSVLMGFGLFLIVASWYGAFMLSRSRYIEYEYALTNNEIDIDRISAKSRRKHVFNLNFNAFNNLSSIPSCNESKILLISESILLLYQEAERAGQIRGFKRRNLCDCVREQG